MSIRHVAIVGAGPAGATCAAFCARAGLDTVLVDKAFFPRHKVCGDCINPSCWEIFETLGLADAVRAEEHCLIRFLALETAGGKRICLPMPPSRHGEIALKRAILDHLLVAKAGALGAHVLLGQSLEGLEHRDGSWHLQISGQTLAARFLVAADGRNSTVARLLGMQPRLQRERVAFQTHIRASLPETVLLKILPQGYCGAAPVNGEEVNLCLVATPRRIEEIKAWARDYFHLESAPDWRSITPLRRADQPPVAGENLFFIGDAARVIEPFTGEGIYYAMRSGQLLGETLGALRFARARARDPDAADLAAFRRRYDDLYRDRLWVNRLARSAVTRPAAGNALITLGAWFPGILASLIAKVIRDG